MSRRRAPTAMEPPIPLACPRCHARFGPDARFCDRCGLPLVFEGIDLDPPPARDARHEWARKVKPQLSEGALIRVVQARNQAEAEFIQALLLEEGVPSLLRRSAGFDVPDFLAAGPRDVLVPESGLQSAREALLQADLLADHPADRRPVVAPGRLLAGLLVALALGALAVWLLADVIH